MKKNTTPEAGLYRQPAFVISRLHGDTFMAINLDTLKQYNFEGVTGDIFSQIGKGVAIDKIFRDLVEKSDAEEADVQEELHRVLDYLLSKGLVEKV